jgi:hypothetical protein
MPCAVSRMSTASSAFAVDSNAPRCVSTSATTARPSHLDTTTPRRPSRSRQGRLYGKNSIERGSRFIVGFLSSQDEDS